MTGRSLRLMIVSEQNKRWFSTEARRCEKDEKSIQKIGMSMVPLLVLIGIISL